jgi:3-dehydroquinate dehydratase/shikimate dehydrogenase
MWFHRPKWEGGEYEGEDEPRFEALQLAMELGAEYVDIELKVGPEYNISFSILH